jgi:hypothetical protein
MTEKDFFEDAKARWPAAEPFIPLHDVEEIMLVLVGRMERPPHRMATFFADVRREYENSYNH